MKWYTSQTIVALVHSSVGHAISQTCPSYTAGYTGTDEIHDSSSGRLYVNESPSSLRARCDGTVYRWHYCYYPAQRENNLEVAFGAFRAETDDGEIERYYLRSGSYYLLQLDMREDSFTCGSVDLDEQDYFQIYEHDRVGACMRNGDNEFLDILAEDAPNYRVGTWGSSSGSCQEGDMTQSSEEPDTEQGFILHLYVDISKTTNCNAYNYYFFMKILMSVHWMRTTVMLLLPPVLMWLEERTASPAAVLLATLEMVLHVIVSIIIIHIHYLLSNGIIWYIDIDECQLELDACVDNADCTDTMGSYMCTCSSGYSGDGLINCESKSLLSKHINTTLNASS